MSDWNEAINAAMNLCENYSAKQGEPIQGYDWGYKDALADIKSMLGSLKRPADQDGFKLVPVEPTMKQRKCLEGKTGTDWLLGWREMISCAPTPEAK